MIEASAANADAAEEEDDLLFAITENDVVGEIVRKHVWQLVFMLSRK